MAKREDILRKVQGLLNKAQSTNFDEERDALIAKADELMANWAIAEFELSQAMADTGKRIKAELREFQLGDRVDYEVSTTIWQLFYALAEHVGALIGGTDYRRTPEYRGYIAKVVGYPSDLDYLGMLFVTLQLHIVRKMVPQVDPTASELENYANLREAGMSYEQIAKLLGYTWLEFVGQHQGTQPKKFNHYRQLRADYQKLCASEGREPVKGAKGRSDIYRKSFMEGYVRRINSRLRAMKVVRSEIGTGKELVLASRSEDLYAVFYIEFPEKKPHPQDCQCDRCHFLKCDDVTCKRPRCVEARKPVKYSRQRSYREERVDSLARRMGESAANEANLSAGGIGGSRKGLES